MLVRDVRDELALAMALIENIQREDLNPIEEAQGIQRLVAEFGMTHEAAAAAVGRSRSGVTNLLRLLGLAKPVQELILHAQARHGSRARAAGAARLRSRSSSPTSSRQRATRSARPSSWCAARWPPPKQTARRRDRDIEILETELSEQLGTRVTIEPRGGKGAGRLVIDYASLDQLDALVGKLR